MENRLYKRVWYVYTDSEKVNLDFDKIFPLNKPEKAKFNLYMIVMNLLGL